MSGHTQSFALFVIHKIAALLFMIAGVLALLVSVAVLVKTAVFVSRSEIAIGRIERVEARKSRSVQYVPIYSFSDSSHVAHQNEGILCSSEQWTTGQKVQVRYTPGDAGQSKLNTFHDVWMVPAMVFVFSSGYLALFIWYYRKMSYDPSPGISAEPL
jgi:hypothetical protein